MLFCSEFWVSVDSNSLNTILLSYNQVIVLMTNRGEYFEATNIIVRFSINVSGFDRVSESSAGN